MSKHDKHYLEMLEAAIDERDKYIAEREAFIAELLSAIAELKDELAARDTNEPA